MTVTHTRTHTFVTFANPYLTCAQCGADAQRFHDPERCGCTGRPWGFDPCGHTADLVSDCKTWNPVDGCLCAAEPLGTVPHPPAGAARSGDG